MASNSPITLNDSILAQNRPSGTTAVSSLSPSSDETILVKLIVVCNTTGSAVNYSIYVDDDGTTYDQTTALFYSISLSANSTEVVEIPIPVFSSSANIAVQTSTADALNFTLIGEKRFR